ncbi:hypothetical protein KKHLCK_14665 [Candidatus Electrothrix laxa]
MISQNPFTIATPIKKSEGFYGRKEILNEVLRGLRTHTNYSLVGERRTGKTSFLLELNRLIRQQGTVLPKHHLCVYFNCEEIYCSGKLFFWRKLIEEILLVAEELLPEKSDEIFSLNKKIEEALNASIFHIGSISRAFSKLTFNIHIIFDEFDQFHLNRKEGVADDFGNNFYSELRSTTTRCSNISYVFATRRGLKQLQPGFITSPLWNVCTPVALGPFSSEDINELICHSCQRAYIPQAVADQLCAEKKELYAVTGYHPYFVQCFLYYVVDEIIQVEKEFSLFQVKKSALKRFEINAQIHFSYYFDHATDDQEQEVLKGLAAGVVFGEHMNNEIKELRKRCLVVPSLLGDNVQLFSSFFEQWLRNEQMEEQQAYGELTWLHLSDLYLDNMLFFKEIRESFFSDLKKMLSRFQQIDFILVTGNLTCHGTSEEFDQASIFFDELWKWFEEMKQSPKLFVVPGNRDICSKNYNEDPILKIAVRSFSNWINDKEMQAEFWEDFESPYREVVHQSFVPYMQWRDQQEQFPENIDRGIVPGDFSVSLTVKGIDIGIVGLNTAFPQLVEENGKKGAIHSKQFNAVCGGDSSTWIKKHHACLLLTHHPFNLLHDDAQKQLQGDIWGEEGTKHFAAHLCGHGEGKPQEYIFEGGQHVWREAAFGLDGDTVSGGCGYSFGQLRLTHGDSKGLIFLSPRVIDTETGEQKIYSNDSSFDLIDDHIGFKEFSLLKRLYLDSERRDKGEKDSERDSSVGSHSFNGEQRFDEDRGKELDKRSFEERGIDLFVLKEPVEIFVSYSREDISLLEQLKKQFSWLIIKNHVEFWHDNEINVGQRWEKEIYRHLKHAPVILLLLSPDFFNSEWCRKEMELALKREKANDALVIPLYLRAVPRYFLLESMANELQATHDLTHPLVAAKNVVISDVDSAKVVERVVEAIEKSLYRMAQVSEGEKQEIEFEEVCQKKSSLEDNYYRISKKPVTVSILNQCLGLNLKQLDCFQAEIYAERLGGRLATVDEWEHCYQKKKIYAFSDYQEWLHGDSSVEGGEFPFLRLIGGQDAFRDLMKIETVAGRLKNFTINQRVDEARSNYAFRLVIDEENK